MSDKIYTISEISRLIKRTLEENPELNSVWVKGEVSNLTYHSSGHIYFTLKDEGALISAVFFKYANRSLSFRLEEGMSLLVFGSVSIFEKRGSYQFIVAMVRLEGIGELQKRIEQLKKKLLSEGLFAPSRKKNLPFLPRRIGVVTSPTGAALRDIIKVAMRRFPNIELLIAPALVQGADAPSSLVKGITELNRPEWDVDVIIACRGGGSFEDLMPFNEEVVVRAVAASRVPIVSAVGHQIDHPLSDDAADFAAPTPSAAAEIILPVKDTVKTDIDKRLTRAHLALLNYLTHSRTRIEGILLRPIFRNPREIIYNRELLLSDLEGRLSGVMKDLTSRRRNRLLLIPDLQRLMSALLREKTHRYNITLQRLEHLSPLSCLKRGYSLTLDAEGTIVRSIGKIKKGDFLKLILFDGTAACTVHSIEKGVPLGEKGPIKK